MLDREAWLEERRKGIGASDVAAILGLSPWNTPYALYAEKVGLVPLDAPGTEAMEFGLRAEPMLRAYFEDRTGLRVIGEQTNVVHPDHAWAKATLDGYAVEHGTDDPELAVAVVEFKSTADAEWTEVPAHYACQATWQMFVTGAEAVMFGVLHLAFGRPTFRIYEFKRDESDIAYVADRCRRFWYDHISMGIPPEVDGSDVTTTAIVQAYPEPIGDVLEADAAARVLVERVRNLTEMAERDDELGRAKNELRHLLREHEALVDPAEVDAKGRPRKLASFKTQSRTSLDAAALRERYPRAAARFTRETTTRVLRVN